MSRNGIEVTVAAEDRFDRLRRIEWWNQDCVARSRVLVVGAGALGNEILKNLALIGVGHIFVADLDTVEESNLSRSVLFRQPDAGRPKAEVAARGVHDIYPGARVGWCQSDVIYELGLGVYRWADVVIAGLDNREARLHVNRGCYRLGRPFVDGATEVFRGVARVFVPPEGACYECTMSAADWAALKERRGCAGMRSASGDNGRAPTTPVTASIVAALESQEAIKSLHGITALSSEGVVLDGMVNDFYAVRYSRNEDCNSHEPFSEVMSLQNSVTDTEVGTLLDIARTQLDAEAVIELRHEVLKELVCVRCRKAEPIWRPLGSVSERHAVCPNCGDIRRAETFRVVDETSDCLDRKLAEIGVPAFDIVAARSGLTSIGFELSADRVRVLKAASESSEAAGREES
jgi:adenylyltransferase/sulfurtransferase